jgi:hypothetical protein
MGGELKVGPKIAAPQIHTGTDRAQAPNEIDPKPIDQTARHRENPAVPELHRDPWGRVMVTTPPRLPAWVPASLRRQIETNRLPEGLTELRTHDGRDALIFHKNSGGFRTYEMMTYLPEDEATHVRAARGDLDAARRLQDASIQWNRDMRHLIEDLGMEPGEARAELRRINEEVFKLVVEAAATLITSAAGVTAVRLPGTQATSPKQARVQSAAAPARKIDGFTAAESAAILEARTIVRSAELAQLEAAHAARRSATVRVGDRLIQYEPDLAASGMTMFGENGFLLGREAFASRAELGKTILHELYRLGTSASAGGVSGQLATSETEAAFRFAERALGRIF